MNQTIFENLPQKMNLISDLFSRVVFRDKEACQDLVKIILGEGYEVTGVTSQYDITNLQFRSVVLDILAETAGEEPIHVEFQISDDDDHMRRVRYCNGSIDTHLLQKALRTVLGNHVEQKGSYVDPERLRFDFTHFQSMTEEEIKKVEDIVNEKIAEAIPVETKIMTIEEAKNTGAMALFGEKYGEKVRVVCMGDFSKEFCGGTHVANTANIRLFKIVSESGVAAGVRRIEALTDKGVLKFFNNLETLVKEASIAAKAESTQLVRRIHTMNDEIKALISENDKLKAELANNALGDVTDNVVDVKGVKLLATKVDNVDMNELRNLGDKLKGEIGSGVVLVVSALAADKVNMIAMATDDVVAKGAHAGNLIKSVASLVGGGGGGRPNMAQAGGKNASGIDELLKKAPEVLAEQL